MGKRAAEKIADSLAMLLEGYNELKENLKEELSVVSEDEDEEIEDQDVDAAMVTEVKAAIETALESEDYSPELLGSAIAVMTEALEEIDPSVFESSEEEDDSEEETEEYDDEDEEDIDYEEDDDDLEEYEEEDE